MRIKSLLAGTVLAAGLALGMGAPSYALPLVLGSGWQSDTVTTVGTASVSSPLTFDTAVPGNYQFSLTDAFVHGDTYTITLNGVDVFTTTLGTTFTPFDNSTGPFAAVYGPAWTDPTYSKIALDFGPGSYSFVVTGDCGGGCPAAFGYRLDQFSVGVPEPATWAMLLIGFGLIGGALRGHQVANRQLRALQALPA